MQFLAIIAILQNDPTIRVALKYLVTIYDIFICKNRRSIHSGR